MKSKPLSERPIGELHKQKKLLTGSLTGFAILWGMALGVLIYVVVKKHSYATLSTFIPVSLLTLLPILISLGNTKKEIVRREQEKS